MGLIQTAAPSAEPITPDQAKLHCRIDTSDENALIDALIVSARQQAEQRTGRALITQQWECALDFFPAWRGNIFLPNPVLQSVQSVTYLDADGIRQTLPATDYQVVNNELIGRILPAFGKTWPSCRIQPGSVIVKYTAGYGDAAAVPQGIKTWMLMAIGTWYAQREVVITGTIVAELPRDFFAALLDPFTVPRVL